MRRLFPEPAADVDPYVAYDDVPRRWLRLGMVMSVDGSATDEDGWTDRLGGAPDFRIFRTLRALADGILVGAATVRTGRVGPHRLAPALRERRDRPPAAMVIVSRRLDLDWRLPIFTSARTPTLVVTCAAGLREAGPVPASVGTVVAGDGDVDLTAAVAALRTRYGLEQLLCEGGPTLAAGLVAAGLIDELCLNVAPTLLGAGPHTPPFGPIPVGHDLTVRAVYADADVLFLRYTLGPPR
jgi:riboflavin biosynthesis pyrimidine reductase